MVEAQLGLSFQDGNDAIIAKAGLLAVLILIQVAHLLVDDEVDIFLRETGVCFVVLATRILASAPAKLARSIWLGVRVLGLSLVMVSGNAMSPAMWPIMYPPSPSLKT